MWCNIINLFLNVISVCKIGFTAGEISSSFLTNKTHGIWLWPAGEIWPLLVVGTLDFDPGTMKIAGNFRGNKPRAREERKRCC
jgi:hypothetical protein